MVSIIGNNFSLCVNILFFLVTLIADGQVLSEPFVLTLKKLLDSENQTDTWIYARANHTHEVLN